MRNHCCSFAQKALHKGSSSAQPQSEFYVEVDDRGVTSAVTWPIGFCIINLKHVSTLYKEITAMVCFSIVLPN